MPTKTITVCARCGKPSCDGGLWKLIQCIRIKDNVDGTEKVHPDNLIDCSLRWLGLKLANKYRDKPVKTVIEKKFLNWSEPSIVTLEKIEI